MTDLDLRHAAAHVLEKNWRGTHTVPAGGLYPHQWSWDSAFIAFGLRHLSPLRAQLELESLFAAQWKDGRLPQIVFDAGQEDAYFPGPDFWRSGELADAPEVPTAGLVQPPNHAWAVWAVHCAAPAQSRSTGFLERAYPVLCRWHDYLRTRRTFGASALMAAVHPWETGMDNSPAWDGPLSRVPEDREVRLTRPDLRHARPSERPTDAEYRRYVFLADAYRAGGCTDHRDLPFIVEDPGMNALWSMSETSLAAMARELGEPPGPHLQAAERIAQALQTLFGDEAGAYLARDVRTGDRIDVVTVSGLLPLLVPSVPTHDSMLATLRGPGFGLGLLEMVPSYDLTRADADPASYWRGPSWFNTTWMLMRALLRLGATDEAGMLRRSMVRLALAHDFPEYVDPVHATPYGTRPFSWTAALALDSDTEPEEVWA
jgi:hypothetical protein